MSHFAYIESGIRLVTATKDLGEALVWGSLHGNSRCSRLVPIGNGYLTSRRVRRDITLLKVSDIALSAEKHRQFPVKAADTVLASESVSLGDM
jgi:hypothetical protein